MREGKSARTPYGKVDSREGEHDEGTDENLHVVIYEDKENDQLQEKNMIQRSAQVVCLLVILGACLVASGVVLDRFVLAPKSVRGSGSFYSTRLLVPGSKTAPVPAPVPASVTAPSPGRRRAPRASALLARNASRPSALPARKGRSGSGKE